MVAAYRQLDIREVAIVSNPKKLEECKKTDERMVIVARE